MPHQAIEPSRREWGPGRRTRADRAPDLAEAEAQSGVVTVKLLPGELIGVGGPDNDVRQLEIPFTVNLRTATSPTNASYHLMGRLAPKDKLGEYYGLFALTGRAVSFIGPAVLAAATAAFASQRAGMATILVFLAGGAALLWTVREPGR